MSLRRVKGHFCSVGLYYAVKIMVDYYHSRGRAANKLLNGWKCEDTISMRECI